MTKFINNINLLSANIQNICQLHIHENDNYNEIIREIQQRKKRFFNNYNNHNSQNCNNIIQNSNINFIQYIPKTKINNSNINQINGSYKLEINNSNIDILNLGPSSLINSGNINIIGFNNSDNNCILNGGNFNKIFCSIDSIQHLDELTGRIRTINRNYDSYKSEYATYRFKYINVRNIQYIDNITNTIINDCNIISSNLILSSTINNGIFNIIEYIDSSTINDGIFNEIFNLDNSAT